MCCLNTEVKRLRWNLAEFSVHQYEPTLDVIKKYKDGGIAIIDQWICAHARYETITCICLITWLWQQRCMWHYCSHPLSDHVQLAL